jgi:MerR family transcriptional regulator/heat shock protein HspR
MSSPIGREPNVDERSPVYVISIAAQLAGMHPQTLRQYDRLGLVSPGRSGGRNRLYSMYDVARLLEVARLSAEGVNLAGIARVLELEAEIDRLRDRLAEVHTNTESLRGKLRHENQTRNATALVVWRPQRKGPTN